MIIITIAIVLILIVEGYKWKRTLDGTDNPWDS